MALHKLPARLVAYMTPYTHKIKNSETKESETVATIGVGTSFGERAIESSTSLREATVVTRSKTNEFLVLKKEDFQKHVQKAREKELANRIRLLRRNQELYDAPSELLNRIVTKLDVYKIALGETLCKQVMDTAQ